MFVSECKREALSLVRLHDSLITEDYSDLRSTLYIFVDVTQTRAEMRSAYRRAYMQMWTIGNEVATRFAYAC